MEAIILAGGLGTRLQSVVSDVPKPMASIAGKPFLEYIFRYLYKNKIDKATLSVGYKWKTIYEYFGQNYYDINIQYSVEDEPLGTGGAIKKALINTESEDFLIMNGDTFFDVDLEKLYDCHLNINSDLTMALKPMKQFDRYGSVTVNGTRVIGFEEKKYKESGNINGGIYIAKSNIFSNKDLPERFSFESDFMEKEKDKVSINAIIEDKYFIDIGIPEDYYRAQKELPRLYE